MTTFSRIAVTALALVCAQASARPPNIIVNLADDVGELHDIAAAHPDIAARVRALMTAAHTPSLDFTLPRP